MISTNTGDSIISITNNSIIKRKPKVTNSNPMKKDNPTTKNKTNTITSAKTKSKKPTNNTKKTTTLSLFI